LSARRSHKRKPDPPRALFPKLQPRRNGPSREDVVSDQLARLHAATIEALAIYGYPGTSVAKLIALAGVSRLTFYQHFDSKEDCFLASYDKIVEEATERIIAAYKSEQDGAARVVAAYEAFVSELVERPKASRLVLVDILAVGPGALRRVESSRLAFEKITYENSGQLLAGVTLPPILLRVMLGGIWQVARRRLLNDRVQELRTLGGELLLWIVSYNSPAVERLTQRPLKRPAVKTGAPSPARRRAGIDTDAREPDERKRILRAVVELAAREGYAEVSPARIIEEAEVPDASFFEAFESPEQCFLAAVQLLSVEALAKSLGESRAGKDWPRAIQLGTEALLNHIACDRTFARVAFVEVFGAGADALRLREEMLEKTAEMFTRYAPREQTPSPVLAEAIVGAVWSLAYDYVVRDVAHELSALLDYASYIAMAPIIGAEAAVESILARAGEAGDGGAEEGVAWS
jgi:AcrR family transcriptional regulator